MEIIETIPIYGTPIWITILVICGFGAMLFSIVLVDVTKYACWIVLFIGALTVLTGLGCLIALKDTEFKRNEYIVRITDMPAQEFVEKYEVTKHFEYSDVIQVKEIEKK